MYKTLKLKKKTASELIGRICPRLHVTRDDTPPDVAIYRATTGPEGLEIICENDWGAFDHLIRLTISDGSYRIVHFYNPETLARDFVAEDKYQTALKNESRMIWVNDIGPKKAHELVDQYWNGYR